MLMLFSSFDIYSLCSDVFLRSFHSVIFYDLNTYYIETWNLGKNYQCFKTSFMISLGWTQACKGKKLSFLRYSLPWQRNKHTRLSRKKILIDIHNISKYHFLRISWSKDIRYKIAMQFFLPYRRPHPRQFSGHFTKKLPNQSSYHKC